MVVFRGISHSSVGKESTCNAGDPGFIPGMGRSTGEGIGYPLHSSWASFVAQLVKNPPAMWETWVSIPGLGRSPGEGKGYPLQHSGLENSMDCISPWGHKELDTTEQHSLSLSFPRWNSARLTESSCVRSRNMPPLLVAALCLWPLRMFLMRWKTEGITMGEQQRSV